jgi:two-component system OmpR family sensor kinase
MVIYLGSTFVLFALASWIFYHAAKRNMIHQQRMSLQAEAKHLHSVLRRLHRSSAPILYYPKATQTRSAIFDIDRHYIFGNFPHPPQLYAPHDTEWLRLIVPMESHYLGAAYLLLAKPIDTDPMKALLRNIMLFMLIGGAVFAVLGYYLGRLFIAPMRESVEQMNRFIEDTTHELNTPVSTILTNIEMIEALDRGRDVREELGRIAIASRTLSRIYDDLTYLSLNHTYHRTISDLSMDALVQERIDYFQIEASGKTVHLHAALSEGVTIRMDENDAIRLVDNLLSNAIKYNRPGGTVTVTLDAERLIVADTGVGIAPEKIATLHERFRRANTSEGGFGIGLNIVHQIVHHYGFALHIASREHHGTEVIVLWQT